MEQVRNNSESCHLPAFPPIEPIRDSTDELYLTVVHDDTSDSSSASSVPSDSFAPTAMRIKDAVEKAGKRRSIDVEAEVQRFKGAGQRRSYFSSAKRREVIQFGPEVCSDHGSSHIHVW